MAAQHPELTELDLILTLADLELAAWPAVSAAIPAWHPRLEGEAGAGDAGKTGDDGGDQGAGKAGAGGDAGDDEDDDDDAGAAGKGEPDWKREARKHERRARAEKKAREELEGKLRERTDAEKTEHERAVETAREEARAEAQAAHAAERRADRLELAVSRGAKGFRDPEDAAVYLERAVKDGDVDLEDLFDDNDRVKTDALATVLEDILEARPRLKVGEGEGIPDGDGRKGGGAGKSSADMSPDEVFASIRRTGK